MSLKDAIRSAASEKKRQDVRQDAAPKSEITGIPGNQNTGIPESHPDAKLVNLTIQVTKGQRRHWLIEAKKRDTSLTAAIIAALNARFGAPAEE